MEKNNIGRGLQAIIEEYDLLGTDTKNPVSLKISQIDPNPQQPRTNFDQEKLNELADSIRAHGVFTPILVRQNGDRFQLIAGERRLRASQLAGLETIPALISSYTDSQSLEIAIIENVQREGLNPVEEAYGYKMMADHLGYTQEVIAKQVGKSRSHVANTLRLLTLPPEALEEVATGRLTMGQVKPLIGLEAEEILEFLPKVKKEKMPARKVEQAVRLKNGKKAYLPWQKGIAEEMKKFNITVTYYQSGVRLDAADPEIIRKLLLKK